MSPVNTFARNVEHRMRSIGIGQRQLSRDSGVAQASISLLISGKRAPSLETALKLSEALGKSIVAMTASLLQEVTSDETAHQKAKKSTGASPL